MPVPLLPTDLLHQHPALLSFFNEDSPDELCKKARMIEKEYTFVRERVTFNTKDQPPEIVELTLRSTTANLAVIYGKIEALKQLDLRDENLGNLFKTVLWSLEDKTDMAKAMIVSDCSYQIMEYLISIEAVKIAFQRELCCLLALSCPHNKPQPHMQNILQTLSKKYETFTEMIFKSYIYYYLGWIYFIKIIKDSPDKYKIITFLHANRGITITSSDFAGILSADDGSAAEVLMHYLPKSDTTTFDFTTLYELEIDYRQLQAGLKNLLLKSPSLILVFPVVLVFNKEQLSYIYDDLIKGKHSFPIGILIIMIDHERIHSLSSEPSAAPPTEDQWVSINPGRFSPKFFTSPSESRSSSRSSATIPDNNPINCSTPPREEPDDEQKKCVVM